MIAAVVRSRNIYVSLANWTTKLEPLVLLLARLLVARVFWKSGLAKVQTLDVLGIHLPTPVMQSGTYFLFRHEFFPHLPAWASHWAANLAALGELTLPLLLTFGLLARFGALGLLVMTLVIQIFVLPDAFWPTHAWWMTVLALILVRGPGAVSVDRLLGLERQQG